VINLLMRKKRQRYGTPLTQAETFIELSGATAGLNGNGSKDPASNAANSIGRHTLSDLDSAILIVGCCSEDANGA